MKKEIVLNGKKIVYEFQYKQVKNINLRIKTDGGVYVSANRYISQAEIEVFMRQHADFITAAIDKFSKMVKTPQKEYFTQQALCRFVIDYSKKIYPYFESRGVEFPQIKFRSMVSRWGSCNITKKVLTFNKKLVYAPQSTVEYVVIHEFAHFLQANHSKRFYAEVEKLCPDWKKQRQILKTISAR